MRKRRREANFETTPNPSETGWDDSQVLITPKKQKKVVTTPEIRLDDSEISRTPNYQQDDKKQRKKQKKVDQDALLKPKKLQKHKLRKKKQKKVATTTDHSEIDSDDPKKLKKEKETLNKKVVECFYESKDAFIQHQRTVFVEGFWCSPSRDDIKRALIKHFSPCGKVSRVSIPFHCQTGVPMGFAFINMIEDYDKALTLDGSYLDELRLTVTRAVNRSEYYFFTNRTGCERCGIALSTHVKKQM